MQSLYTPAKAACLTAVINTSLWQIFLYFGLFLSFWKPCFPRFCELHVKFPPSYQCLSGFVLHTVCWPAPDPGPAGSHSASVITDEGRQNNTHSVSAPWGGETQSTLSSGLLCSVKLQKQYCQMQRCGTTRAQSRASHCAEEPSLSLCYRWGRGREQGTSVCTCWPLTLRGEIYIHEAFITNKSSGSTVWASGEKRQKGACCISVFGLRPILELDIGLLLDRFLCWRRFLPDGSSIKAACKTCNDVLFIR